MTRYSIALFSSALAFGTSQLVESHLRESPLFLSQVAAVILSSFYGGLGPGLLSTLLSILGINFFILHHHMLWQDYIPLGLYSCFGLYINWKGDSVRSSFLIASRTENTLRFLSEASTLLARFMDTKTAKAEIAKLAVPRIADWCILDLIDENKVICRIATIASDPHSQELSQKLEENPPRYDEPEGPSKVIRTGEPAFFKEVSIPFFARFSKSPEHLLVLQKTKIRSVIITPLISRGRIMGAMTLVTAQSNRTLGQAEFDLARDFANRAAICLDNAFLFRQAQEAVQLREDFISIATHEIKTPLSALLLQLQLLFRMIGNSCQYLPGVPQINPIQKILKIITSCEKDTQRLAKLLDDLLDLTRVRIGKLQLNLKKVDICQIVATAASSLSSIDKDVEKRLRIHTVTPILGVWDPTRLEQVVTNLLSNALKYSESTPVDISVGEDIDKNLAFLKIQDYGIGISSDMQSKIFQRFQRVNPKTTVTGFGLGLFIAKQIIEAHAGSIRFESELKKGSTFIVELPLIQNPKQIEAA